MPVVHQGVRARALAAASPAVMRCHPFKPAIDIILTCTIYIIYDFISRMLSVPSGLGVCRAPRLSSVRQPRTTSALPKRRSDVIHDCQGSRIRPVERDRGDHRRQTYPRPPDPQGDLGPADPLPDDPAG